MVGHYCVEVRCIKTAAGQFKAAYIVEHAVYSGPKDFVMITLLEVFADERSAVDAAMERGSAHADWLTAARSASVE
jgi:hypothetical protein